MARLDTPLTVRPGETGAVRVFAIDLPEEAVDAFVQAETAHGSERVAPSIPAALGVSRLDPGYVDVVALRDLDDVGLEGLLRDGHGIARADLEPERAGLDALDGHVVILGSKAFGGMAATLAPSAPLRLIGGWSEDAVPVAFDILPDAMARGSAATPGSAGPATHMPLVTLLIALLALPALVAAGLALFFWLT